MVKVAYGDSIPALEKGTAEVWSYEDGRIKLSQPAYTRRVLERFKFENCRAVTTPKIKGTCSSESGKVILYEKM